jgi:hypothetical protein
VGITTGVMAVGASAVAVRATLGDWALVTEVI